MEGPLIARLLLDAQSEFLRAADAVPASARNDRVGHLNSAGWVVAHAAFFHDVWITVDGQGRSVEECEPWLRAWIRKQSELVVIATGAGGSDIGLPGRMSHTSGREPV